MPFSGPLSRRSFLHTACIGVAAPTLECAPLACIADALTTRQEFGNPLHEFRYGQVELQPGVHQQQLEQTHAILMGMNEDSLLRPFRMAAGMPAPGCDLGGWYSATQARETTGPTGPTTFGQWISALSRYHAATGDGATRLKVRRLVEGYAETIEPHGKIFHVSNFPSYFYDKLVCGLVDAYEFAGVESTLSLISHTTDAAQSHLPGKALDEEPGGTTESYTIPENQFIAWQRGGDRRHLEMGRKYLAEDFLFGPLARGENVLPRRHAYSHVNALCSAAKAYLVLGDEKYLKAAVNGFGFVEQQSFATGGWGPSEIFLPRSATDFVDPSTGEKRHYPGIASLGDSILHEKNHFETPCGAYAHLKITRYLLRLTKDSHYGDSMERVMYNTVLGALPLNKFGKAFYQSNYHNYARKAYFDGYGNLMEDEWPCCSGTLPQVAADYRISVYFADTNGVYVNLYIPSTLRWDRAPHSCTLTQSGAYPLSDNMSFVVEKPSPRSFALRFRIPAWAHSPSMTINGERIPKLLRAGSFAEISRQWRDGDKIVITLPKVNELVACDAAHPDLVSLRRGPMVLFAMGEDLPRLSRQALLSTRQRSTDSAEFAAGRVTFLPWWMINDDIYTTYHDVS